MSRKRSPQSRQRRYDPLAVLSYIATSQQTRPHRSPSQRQIQAAFGISAPSVVHNLLRRLERDELLTVTRYGRGHLVDLTLTEAGRAALERWRAERTSEEQS